MWKDFHFFHIAVKLRLPCEITREVAWLNFVSEGIT